MNGPITRLKASRPWRSLFRAGLPGNPRERAKIILSNVFLHIHPVRVKRHGRDLAFTWGLGGLSFLLLLILTLTGLFLMFYYRPTAACAWEDMQRLRHDVPFGPLMRNMHRWAAHLMVLTVWLHMIRVFMTGSYKPPREFNWVIGVGLLVLTLLLSFTGYLLPYDKLAHAAGTVAGSMAASTPLLGHQGPLGPELGLTEKNDIAFWLQGESAFGEIALLRAYVWHCIGLPALIFLLCAVHFWRVRKDGGISGPEPGRGATGPAAGPEGTGAP